MLMRSFSAISPITARHAARLPLAVVLTLGATGCCFGGSTTTSGTPGTGTGTTGTGPVVGGGPMVTIGPGFLPDPQTATGTAGGPVPANTWSPDCRGYVAAAPNHVLNATGQFMNLRIVVSSSADTTLVVRRADGMYVCNDDSEGLNPIVMGPFGPGQHQIWVGSYSPSSIGTPYTIGFTELMTVTAASLGGGGMGFPGGGGLGALGTALIPQECGQAVPSYGPITVGSSIVLGGHTPYSGPDGRGGMVTNDANWADEMARWVGQRTTVTELGGTDSAGCPGIRVAADNNTYFWRIRNVTF
jgi:hypothetical protein